MYELGERRPGYVCLRYNAQAFASAHNHGLADFESFFGGLEIVPPGVGQAEDWRPGATGLLPSAERVGQVLVGAGQLCGPA